MQVSRTTNYRPDGHPNRWRILCSDQELQDISEALAQEVLDIEAHVIDQVPAGYTREHWNATARERVTAFKNMRAIIEEARSHAK